MTAPLDLAGIAAWVSRPGATPAPTAGPGDPPTVSWPTGPCVNGHIAGDLCTCPCDTTRDLIGVALAPEWRLEAAPPTRWSQSGGYWTAAA